MSRAEQKLVDHKTKCEQCRKAKDLAGHCRDGRLINRLIYSEKNLRNTA